MIVEVKASATETVSGFKGGQRMLTTEPVRFSDEHLELAAVLPSKIRLLARLLDHKGEVVLDWCDLADKSNQAKLFPPDKKKTVAKVVIVKEG